MKSRTRAGWAAVSLALALGGLLACSDFRAEPSAEAATDAGDERMVPESPADGGDGSAGSAYARAVLAESPVVYWRMNSISASNEIVDETPRHMKLILQGGGHELVPGAVGGSPDDDRAVRFNGKTSFARAVESQALDFANGAPFTIELWARRDPIEGGGDYYQHLLGKVEGFNDSAKGYLLVVSRENATNRSGVEIGDGTSARAAYGRLPALGAWAHYAAVFDGAVLRFFVNGTEEQAIDTTMQMPSRSVDLFVGRDAREDNSYFSGAIDELAIYDKALSLTTIVHHASLGR